MLVGYEGEVRIYASDTGEVQRTLGFLDERPTILIFRDANEHVDVFTQGRKQIRWNWKTGKKVGMENAAYLTYFQPFGFNQDGIKFHASSSSVTIYRTDEDGGRVRFSTGSRIKWLAASGDTKTLVTGHDFGIVQVWNTADQKLLAEFKASAYTKEGLTADHDIAHVAASHDGSVVATGVKQGTNRVRVWTVLRNADPLGRATGTTRLLDISDLKEPLSLHPLKIERPVALTRDGRRLAVMQRGGGPNPVVVLDVNTGRVIKQFPTPVSSAYTIKWSEDGRLLVMGGMIRVWDLQSGKLLKTLPGHSAHVRAISVAPDMTRFGKWRIAVTLVLISAVGLGVD